ncbi:hypothetical protein AHF37_12490 [Paragonimus kellicotti]|nr:hypothetical protein AHF37_12490 [Paragonimus kellicotti]
MSTREFRHHRQYDSAFTHCAQEDGGLRKFITHGHLRTFYQEFASWPSKKELTKNARDEASTMLNVTGFKFKQISRKS